MDPVPSGYTDEGHIKNIREAKKYANFVELIHCSTDLPDPKASLGNANFFANGGRKQPECFFQCM